MLLKDNKHLEQNLMKHSDDLKRFIYKMTKDYNAQEEILQNTIVTAYTNLGKLRNPNKIKSWLFQIAKTETCHYYQYYKSVSVIGEIDIGVQEKNSLDLITEAESMKEVRHLLSNLEEKYFKIIMLHYYFDLPLKEIAEIFDISYNTVRTNHRRGIEKLKKGLRKS